MSTQTLRLGSVDHGAMPPDLSAFLMPIHEMTMLRRRPGKMRGERKGEWLGFQERDGRAVTVLQRRLKHAGVYPYGSIDGVYDYRVMASVRLFQEYVRTVEGDLTIGAADGIAGPMTQEHLQRWDETGLRSAWGEASSDRPTPAYRQWMQALHAIKAAYTDHPTALLRRISQVAVPSDTVPVAGWRLEPGRIQLVGIRRDADRSTRANDDVFVLLLGGLVFAFFGTTDPGTTTNAAGAPFLVHGQHRYRFGWHKQSNMDTVYRALKPCTNGVLVVRDGDRDFVLDEDEMHGELEVNPSINIHWGGRGTSNWSAGCQVVCGRAYINHADAVVDCTASAAVNYSTLGTRVNSIYQTKGAYTVLADLITAFSGSIHEVDYLLLYEADLDRHTALGAEVARRLSERMR